MGAVTFSIDVRLLETLKRALPLTHFVETGTFKGDALHIAAPYFTRLDSVEISEPLWREAAARFAGNPAIEVHRGDSAGLLARLAPGLAHSATLFWLDAHWCVAENAAGEHSQCPLLEEIAAIGTLAPQSVILVDDARLFLAAPPAPHDVGQWPTFAEVVAALQRAGPAHELMVLNDVIVFHPAQARAALQDHAHRHGVDWLHAAQALGELRALRGGLEEKEAFLQSQAAQLRELHDAVGLAREQHRLLAQGLAEKEAVIASLRAGLDEARERLARLESREREQAHHEVDGLRARNAALAARLQERDTVVRELSAALAARDAQQQAIQEVVRNGEERMRAAASASDSPEVRALLVRGLEEKEAVIRELSRALEAFRQAQSLRGMLLRPLNRFAAWAAHYVSFRPATLFTPRLGNLNQHPPRDLRLPARYALTPPLPQAPRISLVTPSFRQAAFIERTLRSVLDQHYPNLEYHVQDGGSDDGTREILERYAASLAGWDSRPDNGQAHAINLGFARATGGEIMAWLNSDDLLLPGALHFVADYFTRHPEVDVVYGHRILIDENDRQIGRWIMPGHSHEVLSWADYVPQETLFWRRRIWERVGAHVDESFRFAMDWDLLLRFRDAGACFARLPRLLGAFRIHPHQKTSAAISEVGFREMDRLRERALGRVPSGIEVRKAVFPYLLRHVFSDMRWAMRERLGGL